MPDLEKVIMGLSRHGNSDCEYDKETMCPYWGESHCSSRLCLDALALLKAQEPRVMTWDEVRAAMKAPVWKETKSMHNALYHGWVLAYDIQAGQGITGTRLGMAEPSGRVVWYKAEDYGKTWRCWDKRPTEEQRKAVKWDA